MSLRDKVIIIPREKLSDTRGWLIKVIDGQEKGLPSKMGEIYTIMAKPGECRANHYHQQTNEWFTVIQGTAVLRLEHVTSKEQLEIILDAEKPMTVFVPHHISHHFHNQSDEPFILIAMADRQYNPKDTIPYELSKLVNVK